jgi:D-threo-aldose 1-dehydrogenase
MRHRQIISGRVQVTELGFGAAPIGNLYRAVSEVEARAAIDAAWSAGVRYFDTAPHYGLGLAERRLGAALADRPRDDFAISTKVGKLLVPNPKPEGSELTRNGFDVPDDWLRVVDFSADGVRRSIENSLERLGMDRIDIALVHDPQLDLDAAVGESVPALLDLRDQGVVSAVGVGANHVHEAARFVDETDIDVVLLAGRWTLLDRSAGGFLDDCAAGGVSVLAAAPFNSGLLAAEWPEDDAHFDYVSVSPSRLAHARAYAQVCRDLGDVLPHVALNFPLRHPAVASVVAGIASAREATKNANWITAPVGEDLWRAIDAVDDADEATA